MPPFLFPSGIFLIRSVRFSTPVGASAGGATAGSFATNGAPGFLSSRYVRATGALSLEAALKRGACLPYACKAGVCCTCRAKLVEGEVRMDANYTLEADEVARGFRLTCQSHPLTRTLVLDFDQR